jgi:hypothetical protein
MGHAEALIGREGSHRGRVRRHRRPPPLDPLERLPLDDEGDEREPE